MMRRMHSLNRKGYKGQRGNIFFMLFAAVALVGAFGVGASTIMRGLVTSMSDVTRKTIAEERMTTTARLAFQHPAQFDPAADCDSATENAPGQIFLEPMVTRDAGSLPHPANGGLIPEDIGASTKDPWGTQYGYCAWDPGPNQCATSIAPRRLVGTADPADTVVAIISAGKDRVFQTTCNDGASPAVTKSDGSDDIVMEFSYNDVQGLGGDDLWKIKDIAPDTATIEKNIEVTGGADFTGAINLMEKGLILPTETDAGHTGSTCLTAQQGEMRINTSTSPISLEICHNNNWTALSMSTSDSGPADCTGLGTAYYNDPMTGHCYYSAGNMNWDDAQAYCQTNGDYLAVVSSAYENAVLYNNMVASGTRYWLGAHERDVLGEWRWRGGELDGIQFWSGADTGAPVAGAYTSWEPGDPSNGSLQACLRIGFYADGTWDDADCTLTPKFICERSGSRGNTGQWQPPAGLIGWWKFDETSGTAAEDSSVNNNTGTLTGGATFAEGVNGNAVQLDGTDDYVTMGSAGTLDETIRSACAWIYPDNLSSSSTGTVMGKTNGGSTGPRLYMTGSGNVGGSVDGARQQSNGILSQNSWHHMCVTWTGAAYTAADVKIYLDGANVTDGDVTAAGSSQSDAALNFMIGQASGTDFFKGKIDEAMIFDRELTENEILSIYQNSSNIEQVGGSCNFSNITQVTTRATGADYNTMLVHNGYLWNTRWDSDRLYFYNLSNPAAPGTASYIQDGVNLDRPTSITGMGNYLYVLSYDNGRVTVVDVSSPTSPVVRGSVTHARLGQGTSIQPLDQNHVVVSSQQQDRITIVNVSNPAAPALAGSVTNASMIDPDGLDVVGNYIYAPSPVSGSLTIWDATDRNNPVLAGQVVSASLTDATNVKISGRYAYVITFNEDEIVVVDVNNPAVPVVVGEGTDARMSDTFAAQIVGNYLFTASLDAILVWSLSNPVNPMVVGAYNNSTGSQWALSIYDRYAYGYDSGPISVMDLGCNPGSSEEDEDDTASTDIGPDPSVIIAVNRFAGKFATGKEHSCYIKPDSSGWCGGSNVSGQLGIGIDDLHQETLVRTIFTSTPWPGLNWITASFHNTCALDTGGLAWCWGEASKGKLGNGTTTPQANNPVQVSDGHRFTKLDVGGDVACGLRQDGRILCWGDDTRGAMGNGASGASTTPFLMPDVGPWVKVAVGGRTACGIKADGTAWCWGQGNSGQLGNNTTTTTNQSPLLLADAGPWLDIVVSFAHACGIKIDGTAWCWGSADQGRLGNGTTTGTYSYPQKVLDDGPWLQLSTNKESDLTNASTCGIKMDGSAWCWGNNEDGQLGDGTKEKSSIPVRVGDPGPWALITVGDGIACGMKTNGSLWCWGDDDPLYQTINGPAIGDTRVPTPVAMAGDPAPAYVEANISLRDGSAISYDGSSVSGVANGLRFDTGGQTVLRHSTTTGTSANATPPFTDGLIGHWSFNEITGSTTAADSVGGSTATLAGDAVLREGKYGNAVYLDGAGDSANVAANGSINNTIMSACAWILQETLLQPYGAVFYKSNHTDGGFELYTFDNLAGRGGIGGRKNSTSVETQNNLFANNQWNHICASWSGESSNPSSISLYLNGELYTQTPVSTTSGTIVGDDSSANLLIGYNFKGFVDEFMIFNRPLTAEDVAVIYAAPYYTGSVELKLDAQGSAASSQISWKAASASTTRTLGIDYLTRSLELGHNNAAVTNWLHAVSPVMEITETGNVGIGTSGTANARLDISNGGLRLGNDTSACFPTRAGTIRYIGGATPYEFCDGTTWQGF